MNLMKLQLKWAARIEFIATGFYLTLSRSYAQKERIAKTLALFSKDERRHGLMFSKGLKDEFGKSVRIGPWEFCGRILAFLQYFIPLRWKLKTISVMESMAVTLLSRELEADPPNRFEAIVKKIQPDEIRHASFYDPLYGREVTSL